MTGRLSNNLLVHFPGDESMIGTFADVSLDECKGFYYIGKNCRKIKKRRKNKGDYS
ncbi:MAG: TRAM domain-containing protein [[Ruminococcus] torques]